MKTPKSNTRLKRSRKGRSHLPSLSQVQRDMLRMQMEADARIPRNVSEAIMASMNAAANPDAEKIDVVIASLSQEEKALIVPFQAGYSAILGSMATRGQVGLMQITDGQWNALIDDDA